VKLGITCYPTTDPSQMLRQLDNLPVQAVLVYSDEQALAARSRGYTIGGFYGGLRNFGLYDFIILGDEPNNGGKASDYYNWARVAAAQLRVDGFKGRIVGPALKGQWTGWWIFRKLVPDEAYLKALIELDRTYGPVFDGWACNPFESTMGAWKDVFTRLLPDKPIYLGGFGWQRWWYQYLLGNPYVSDLQILKGWTQVQVGSLWCLGPDGNYGHVDQDGRQTLSGAKLMEARQQVGGL